MKSIKWVLLVASVVLWAATAVRADYYTYGWVDVDYQQAVGGSFNYSKNAGGSWTGTLTGGYRSVLSGFEHRAGDEDQTTLTAAAVEGTRYLFCIDLGNYLADQADAEIIRLEDAPTLGGSGAKAGYLRELVRLYQLAGVNPAVATTQSHAMSLAAWEIVYDTNAIGDNYLGTGTYRAKDGVVTDGVKAQVETWLDQIYTSGGMLANNIYSLQHAGWQGLLVETTGGPPPSPAAPEPAVVVQLLGAATMGLGMFWVRRRRRGAN